MKLLNLFAIINEAQFLVERDVINAKELKQWAKQSAARITDPQAATWYASQLFKYLINRYEDGLRTAQFDANAPDWVMAKLDAGEQIYTVEPQQKLRQEAEQVIDWLNANQVGEINKLNLRMTWEDAVEGQDEWHKDIARQSRVTELTAEQMEGIVTIMEFDDGFRWVDVQTEVCLQHEGTVMGHCVGQGGYTQGVKEGLTKILSLRDGNNNPHATIEGRSETPIHITPEMMNSGQLNLFVDNALEASFVDLALSQIKGKENKAVVRKYRDYVQEFLTKFQINKFGYGGLNDLENCGLFKLKKGGYVNVEEIGEHVAQMDDGSVWHRVDNEYVELMEHTTELYAKWYLYDKTGRAIGGMNEGQAGVINTININHGYNQPVSEKEKYKNHVITAFNTKYDKGRSGIKPTPHLYHGFYNTMEGLGLGVDGKGAVNDPKTIGRHVMKHNDSDVYATGSGQGDVYWVISGDKIKSRFLMNDGGTTSGNGLGYMLVFDNNRGIPNGSVTNFIKNFQETFTGDININYIQIKDQTLEVANIEWTPGESSEFIMEEDGVRFYTHVNEQTNASTKDWKREEGDATWYMAIDKHNQLIFSMMLDNELRATGIRAHQNRFKVRMVNDKKVAGYYAIYLIEHLEADVGEFNDYSSFAREILDETGWFQGQRSDIWYVMDEKFPIHLTITDSYDDDTEEDTYDDDTTMETYWQETSLQDSGMEEDYFAAEYEQVYRGGNTGWDEEDGYDDLDNPGRTRIRVDYSVEGIGDADTVTHPISGGSVRISL